MFKKFNFIIILALVVLLFIPTYVSAFGQSKYEYHHIFPRAHFGSIGDDSVIKLREFEHKWLHFTKGALVKTDAPRNKRGFDGDWNKVNISASYKSKSIKDWLWSGNYESGITAYGNRNGALIAGKRILSYKILTRDYDDRGISGLLVTKFDGASNILYNVSYLLSIPSKAISFFKFAMNDPNIYTEGKLITDFKKIYLMIWGTFQLVFGFFASIIMLYISPFIGFLAHPLQTIANLTISLSDPIHTNIIASLWGLVLAIAEPLLNLFFWTV